MHADRRLKLLISVHSDSIPTTVLEFSTVHCWTYNFSIESMDYEQARQFCQSKYTDLVAIQNKREIEYLEKNIPRNPTYYWIGIRKINGLWTWVGTNKTLTEEATNWGENEPNNKRNTEDCVEIYINRDKDSGKWNDDACSKKKRALCYTASCKKLSCSGHGECIETINNYTCACDAGFYGSQCEHVVQCPHLSSQPQGYMNCSHQWGNFSFQSLCHFGCLEGFLLNGSNMSQCRSSGRWSNDTPHCSAVKCDVPNIPKHGSIACNHLWSENSYGSTCEFKCSEGWKLNGSSVIKCGPTGDWTEDIPECEAVQCPDVSAQPQRYVNCSHPWGDFSFQSFCHFGCLDGFLLDGSNRSQCLSSGRWSTDSPYCIAVHCPHLSAQPQGYMNCSHPWGIFRFQSLCHFGCLDGFLLHGNDTSQCLSSGRWSKDTPHCAEQMTFLHHPLDHQKAVFIVGLMTAASALTLGLALWLIIRQRKKEYEHEESSVENNEIEKGLMDEATRPEKYLEFLNTSVKIFGEKFNHVAYLYNMDVIMLLL
ncbi:L-selectin-like [Pseudophryne corroboree]|uniref:L-selectin-like n=1 Tax=Pseudophryne corroboree TaxID=495146 RepID=UPI003081B8B8